jgi:Leucine-rich repeat (LRR) protein
MSYKFLATSLLLLFTLNLKAQVLDSITLDSLPTYNLQQALEQDPLKVYKLSLKKMKLTELPTEVLNFKNLQYLNLQKNRLKTFPTNIKNFTHLQELNISYNNIEIIPKELGQLLHLIKFTANNNQIVSLPKEIKHLKKLKYIDIWGNDIGALPFEIQELKDNLIEIDMRVILMSKDESKKIKALLPNTKIRFSKSCNCAF